MLRYKQLFSTVLMLLAGGLLTLSAHSLTKQSPTVTENFNSMWSGTEATLTLPDGWRIDRNLNAPRTVNPWSSAATEVMYTGGVSLASNASNGTWNWGKNGDSDRAVGGLTTTVTNGTRCINVMTSVTNADEAAINRLILSYDIEKYREGDNAAGFAVQVYTSTDGENWTPAGNDLYTYFAPDAQTLGAEVVPISVTAVSGKNLLVDIAAGSTLYIAWNISVASGTSPNKAPGLAIDNIQITANFAGEGPAATNLYIEDVTGWEKLMVHAADGTLGAFPGMASTGSKTVNGVAYKAFELPTAPITVAANNGVYYSLPSITLNEAGDHYYTASTKGLTAIADPQTYTGYVDPSIPAFKASGIYLRGEVNSWGAPAEWEFSDEGNGTYALYNKTLSGQFKVADASWSSACNYGSNGSNAYPETPYATVLGTNDNISCGPNIYMCKEIRFTIADGVGTLTITTNDDGIGLTSVYAVGDFNSWNFMNVDGKLTYDTADGKFRGKITMPKGASDELSHWRIYQRLGMGGAWGLEADQTASTLQGTLVKGKSGNAAVEPGTYTLAFDLATGEYSLVKEASVVVDMTVRPTSSLVVPALPEKVKVLSLNNSLIYYNDQDHMFNQIAATMGKDAAWTKHTLLGKSLQTHWEEGEGLAADGNPGAKMMVRSDAWSHIILQEQSALPRTNPATFLASARQWIEYIRANCPNPHAIIILPMNWGYSSDWDNFLSNNAEFAANYREIAADLGVVVCPVASAYSEVFKAEGATGCAQLFQDDRHPTPKASYLAACMEYALIYGVDPATITGTVEGVDATDAAAMRAYASQVMNAYSNHIDHNKAQVNFLVEMVEDNGLKVAPTEPVTYTATEGTVTEQGIYTAPTTPGTYTVTATCGEFTRTAQVVVAQAKTDVVTYPAIELNEDKLAASELFDAMGTGLALPEPWRIDRNIAQPRGLTTYAAAATDAMYAGGVSLPSNAKNGTWNFGADTDRALGGITTGVAGGTRAVNVYTHLLNTGGKNLTNVTISYDVEKYRKGNNSAGFAVQLYYSYNGNTWTSAGQDFYTYFAPDSETAGYAQVPGETVAVSGTLPVDLQRGVDLYLAWNISAASGDNCAGAMALGIDNFNVSAELPPVPTATHYIYAEDLTGWDALGLYAWGTSELFGAWPGEASVDVREIGGTTYKVFLLENEVPGSYNLIFNNWNNGKQTPDFTIAGDRDYYLIVTETSVTEREPSAINDVTVQQAFVVNGDNIVAPGAAHMSIYSISGALVGTADGETIGTSHLSHGVYVVRASSDGRVATCKFVR
ncbi:MAG: starch-binding protein [Muribaculaceae bacterium]|nr:starch-binding protein [Muribaculaceae bacterium]